MARTIQQRAVAIIDKLTAAGTYNENDYQEEDVAVIKREFADVVETDPRVLALVEAASAVEDTLRGFSHTSEILACEREQVRAALKPFQKQQRKA